MLRENENSKVGDGDSSAVSSDADFRRSMGDVLENHWSYGDGSANWLLVRIDHCQSGSRQGG